jgi:phenylacetate-CoA ligase
MIPRFVSRLWMRRYLARNARAYDELEHFHNLTADEQRLDLALRLLAQIRYFGNREDALPEWRDAARISDPGELWRKWPSLPVMTKHMLQTQYPADDIAARLGISGGVISSTGGSTGEPTRFFHDTTMRLSAQGAMYYARERMGWRPGMPTIIVWGSERDIGKEMSLKNRIDGRLRNEYLIDGYRLSEETADRVVRIAQKRKPVAIYGFTSMLQHVAEILIKRDTPLPAGTVVAAWNGGEMLLPEQAEVFRRAFSAPLLNCYGGRELSVMACQFEENGPLHVMRPWLFLEVVDDDGRPAPPGEPGRLLWTSTVCRGTPFLRYEIEDLGAYAPDHRDESGITALSELHGRSAGVLQLANGRKVSNLYWNHVFKDIPGVKQFQVVLEPNGSVRVLLCGPGFPPGVEQHLRNILSDFLGDVRVELQWVDRIPLTRQGKRVHVIRGK